MNIVARKRRKRFVLDEQEDDETNELLNNGTFKMKEFTNNNSPLIAKFGEQILQGEFFYCIQNNLLLRLSELNAILSGYSYIKYILLINCLH